MAGVGRGRGWSKSRGQHRALPESAGADREESDIAEAKSIRLKEKIAGLRRQMRALKVMEQTVQDAPDQQVSLTDFDARSMATSGKGTATVGYNVQIAVDAEHHLIVAHEVTNQGYDRHQERAWLRDGLESTKVG